MKANTKMTSMLAVVVVMVMAFAAIAVVAPAQEPAASEDITYIYGDIIENQKYEAGKIIVQDNLNVKAGAELSLEGAVEFYVPAGVTLTINGDKDAPATFSIGAGVSAVVDGTLVIGQYAIMTYSGNANFSDASDVSFFINGTMEISKTGGDNGEKVDFGSEIPESLVVDGTVDEFKTLNLAGAAIFTEKSTLKITSASGAIANVSGTIFAMPGATISVVGNCGLDVVSCATTEVKEKNYVVMSSISLLSKGDAKTTTDLSSLSIKADVNKYAAWIKVDKEIKATVWESNIVVSGTVKGGDTLSAAGFFEEEKLFYAAKADVADAKDYFLAQSKIIINGDFNVKEGSFNVDDGVLIINADASITAKNKEDVTAEISFEGAWVYVYGLIAVDDTNWKYDGFVFVQKDGMITVKDSTDASKYLDTIQGSYYYDDENEVSIISDFETILTAATLDADVDKIVVSGQDPTVSTLDLEQIGAFYYINGDYEVREGLTLCFQNNVVICEENTLTIAKDASVNGNSGVVDIRGIIKDCNCSIKNLGTTPVKYVYQVIIAAEDESYELYMSLGKALDTAKAGDNIEVVNDVTIDSTITIPADVKLTLGKTAEGRSVVATITDDGKVINNGIFDVNNGAKPAVTFEDESVTTPADADKYVVNNNLVIGTNVDFIQAISGFYAVGAIFEDDADNTPYIMSAKAFQTYSECFDAVNGFGSISYADTLTIKAAEDEEAALTFESGTYNIKEIVLQGYTMDVADLVGPDDKGFSGIVTISTTDGKTSVLFKEQGSFSIAVDEDDGEEGVSTTYMLDIAAFDKLEIISGKVVFEKADEAIEFATKLTVDNGAVLDMGENDLTYGGDFAELKAYNVVIDGKLVFSSDATLTGVLAIINGTMEILDEVTVTLDGTISVLGILAISTEDGSEGMLTLAAEVVPLAEVYIGVDIVDYSKNIPETSGAAIVTGNVDMDATGVAMVFAGTNAADATFTSGSEDAVSTIFFLDGKEFATAYAASDNTFAIKDFPVYVQGYTFDEKWYSDADMKTEVALTDLIGSADEVYGELASLHAYVKYSIDTRAAMYVNDVRVDNIDYDALQIGTYTVKIVIDPGFTGNVVVKMNGIEITGNTFVITPELAEEYSVEKQGQFADKFITVTATGVVEPTPEPTPEQGMSITEILLIVLVILIAIMAVIVALRLNRS